MPGEKDEEEPCKNWNMNQLNLRLWGFTHKNQDPGSQRGFDNNDEDLPYSFRAFYGWGSDLIHHFFLGGLTYSIHLFTKYVLDICSMPGTVLGILHMLPLPQYDIFPLFFTHCYFTCKEIMAITLGIQRWARFLPCFLKKRLANFSVKGQIVCILGLVVHKISITTSQLLFMEKAAHRQYKNEWTWLWSTKTLFTKIAGWTDLPVNHCLLTLYYKVIV